MLYNGYFATRQEADLKLYYGEIEQSYLEYYSHGTVFKQADVQLIIKVKKQPYPFAIRSGYTNNINEIDQLVGESKWAKVWMYEGRSFSNEYILYQVETNKGIVFPISNMQNYYAVLMGIIFLGFLIPVFLVLGLYYGWIR